MKVRQITVMMFVMCGCGAETVSGAPGDSGAGDAHVDVIADASDAPSGPYVTELVLNALEQRYALMSDGTVRVQGASQLGALGTGRTSEPTSVSIPGLTNIAEVVTNGFWSACARSVSGSLWCWGANQDGQLGVGAIGDETCTEGDMARRCRPRPTRVAGFDDVVSIGMGIRTTCVARRDGSVWCWGGFNLDVLRPASELPTQLSAVRDVVQLWAQHNGWIFRHRDGHFTVLGSWQGRTIPTGATLATSPMAGFVCYRLPDASMRCIGNNPDGELANGRSQWPELDFTALDSGITRVRSISTGAYHACAVLEDGTVSCWGDARNNGLGFTPTERCVGINEPSNCATRPTVVPDVSAVERVFAATWRTCVIRYDHAVWCWGRGVGEGPEALTRVSW